MFEWLTDPIKWLEKKFIESAVDVYKQTARIALSSGDVSTSQWDISLDTANHIAGVMAFVAIACGIYAIVKAMLRGSIGDAITSIFLTLMAWPITVILITFVMNALSVEKDVTSRILAWSYSSDSIKIGSIASGGVSVIWVMILCMICIIGSCFLSITMIGRAFLLILAVAFAPIAIMLIPLNSLRSSVRQWASFITGVILYKPLVAILVYLSGQLCLTIGDSVNCLMMVTFAVYVSIFCPWVLVRIVDKVLGVGSSGLNTMATSQQKTGKAVEDTVKLAASVAVAVATGGASAAAGGLAAGGMAAGGMAAKAANGIGSVASMLDSKIPGTGGSTSDLLHNAAQSPFASSKVRNGLNSAAQMLSYRGSNSNSTGTGDDLNNSSGKPFSTFNNGEHSNADRIDVPPSVNEHDSSNNNTDSLKDSDVHTVNGLSVSVSDNGQNESSTPDVHVDGINVNTQENISQKPEPQDLYVTTPSSPQITPNVRVDADVHEHTVSNNSTPSADVHVTENNSYEERERK